MVFVEEEHCYPDIEAVWKDMCQMRYLEGVGALLEGLTCLRMDLFWQEQFITSDLLLRFFDQRIRELQSYESSPSKAIDWLKELAIITFAKCSLSLSQHDRSIRKPPPRLQKALFLFIRDNKPIAFDGDENELANEISWLAINCATQISAKWFHVPRGLTLNLCYEVMFILHGIENSTPHIIAPFIVNDLLSNAMFFGEAPKKGWTINAILDFCEPNGYFPLECAYLRTCLRNRKTRNLLAKEIGL